MRHFDWMLFIAPIILTVLGILSMYSTSSTRIFTSQIIYFLLAVGLVFLISRIDIKTLINYSYILFIFILLLTLGTLLFGVTRNGTTAWYEIVGYTFQPSEILKLSFILVLTQYYSVYTYHTVITVVKSFLYFLLPILAVLYLQRDIGTGIVFIVIWMAVNAVIYFTQFERKRLFLFLTSGAIFIIGLFYFIIQGYQLSRLSVFPDHLTLNMQHHSEIGYQVDQSLIAIGSSSFWGKGLSHGTQNQFDFLPEKHNDFIFSSIVEEMGISAAFLIFAMYILISFRLFIVSKKCSQLSVDIFIAGSFGLILYHVVQNVGMNIGLVPVTGISLPFVSYGGSFILTSYMLIGLVQSILLGYKKSFL